MKTKRSKANRRTMTVYNSVFKFREPYQVLFDADFAVIVTTQKMEVQSRLAAILGGTIKPMITQCSISHLVNLASDGSQVAQEAVNLARNICERRKCNHWKTKASSVECIKGILGDTENRLRYIVCTQDPTFRTYLREKIVGVPIIYVNRSGTLLLEEEGPASELRRKHLQEEKLHVPQEELDKLKSAATGLDSGASVQLIQQHPSTSNSQPNPPKTLSNGQTVSAHKLETKLMKKKKRRTGAPNPLSVKKKKSSTTNKCRMPTAKSTSTNPPPQTSSIKSAHKTLVTKTKSAIQSD
ncbi:hypothetical protein MJO28_012629 [Puccinia striiformis f. sp. tritici]|uniref:UTP23 sensor motif region domain-containing protein n=4 Tax=Puccinia striiformis TaxID=27350 RepID=A0A0L0VYW0_9BASI|nr:hypothetical protein Pst134EA_022495 [Puccinia striiformis f. sp. tritici]KNF04464.1 hypothetical protein PSTG_02377 [Puccinia striiformis f. sp. tritici PST-78]POW15775.1 hypothetical protein PSHT_07004 [Puccinia striiformis]KAH9445548.1 hypothetical protein Pst134EB_023386 [Puccinia striiformis f. sp. tritici]KAH9455014.1 hypothetical protein Pst134EA_022495 [Puccinia striiformis f. sp. tritici]KAI7933194.1 hypothetical protein MJO28_017780 [Puccinia striiformis f. sp. tritici]